MTSIANLEIELNLDSGQFNGKLRQAGQSVQLFGRQIDSQSASVVAMERQLLATSNAVNTLKRSMQGLVGFEAMRRSIVGLVDAQKTMQRVKFGLAGALGDAQAGAEALEYVREVAQRLGLDLAVTATEFMKITAAASAMGVPMEQQKAVFEGLAKSATVLHLSTDQVKYATMALGQMFSKGKIQAEELRRQLGEQIPGAAAHFQTAVMKMVEGTDLAGYSFDDLLRRGLLTTDKFLPALIEALSKTGRGWEEAANSLQANLSRLGNSWLELKADLSGGLFNDAIIAGSALLADHLHKIAGAIVLMGAATATHFIGPMAQALKNNIQVWHAHGQAIQENLRRDADVAAAAKAAAVRQREEIAQRLNNIKTLQAENAVRLEGQRLRRADAIQNMEGNFGTRMAYLRRNGEMPAAAEANSRRVIIGLLQDQQLNISRATKLELELAAATMAEAEAQAVANAAEQKRLAALPTMANRIKNGLKGASSALLGLVGGPWGAGILAVGGLAYAFYSARQRAEEAREKFDDQIESLQHLRSTINEVVQAYRGMRKEDADVSNVADEWNKANKELRDADARIAELTEKIRRMHEQQKHAQYLPPNFASDLRQAQDELKRLQDETAPTRQKFLELEAVLKDAVDPEMFRALKRAAEEANDADFKKLWDALSETEKRAYVAADAIRGITKSLDEKIWDKQIDIVRRTKGAYEALRLEIGKKLDEETPGGWKNASPEQLALVGRRLKQLKELFAAEDAAKESTKAQTAAEKEREKALQDRENQISSITDRLTKQIETDKEYLATGDKVSAGERLRIAIQTQLLSARNKLTQADKDAIQPLIDEMVKTAELAEAKREEARATEQLARLKEQLAADRSVVTEQINADLMQIAHGAEYVEMVRRKIAIEKDYAAKLKELRDQNIATDSESYRNQRAEIEAHYQWRLQAEADFQQSRRAMEADWTNGFRSAMEDYVSRARNTAELAKNATASSLDELSNRLNEFVETGKLSWRGLMTFILKEIQRVLMAKLVAKFASFVMGLMGGGVTTVDTGANLGGSTYGMSNTYSGAVYSANGNVMTPAGPARLNYYENGGIARSPQLSIFGEGRLPEAYVPLPDGRSIPVTITGGMGGQANINQTSVEVNVHIDGQGNGTVQSDSAAAQGKQIGDLIGVKVKEVMSQEMRPGGLLWRRQHG